MPANPGADWRAERSCPICWTTFTPAGPRHRYCSDRCRKSAFTRRHATGVDSGQASAAMPAPVSVRACPHCGGEVSIVALLTTTDAARPRMPSHGVLPLRRA